MIKVMAFLLFAWGLTGCSSGYRSDNADGLISNEIGRINLDKKYLSISDFLNGVSSDLPDALKLVGYTGRVVVQPNWGWATVYFKDASTDCIAVLQLVRDPELGRSVTVVLRSITTAHGSSGRFDEMQERSARIFSALASLQSY